MLLHTVLLSVGVMAPNILKRLIQILSVLFLTTSISTHYVTLCLPRQYGLLWDDVTMATPITMMPAKVLFLPLPVLQKRFFESGYLSQSPRRVRS